MLDYRKSLPQLASEWEDCTKCELGERRVSMQTEFVFGEGKRRTIMFIGEGPGFEEAEKGRPFIGPSGKLLEKVLFLNGFSREDVYITNAVCCRSCIPRLDEHGLPMRRGKEKQIVYADEPPLPTYMAACRPRLNEEIYLVDPVLIVSLGVHASEALLGRSITITKERGQLLEITLPGVTSVPKLTEKKQVWVRKLGEPPPVESRRVRYPLLPTLHPAYVLRKLADLGRGNPTEQLKEDIKKAAEIYERYMLENRGIQVKLEPRSEEEYYEQQEEHD